MTISRIKKGLKSAIFLAGVMIAASGANAASVTYGLNIANVGTTDPAQTYVAVTIADGTGLHAGDIKFTVDANNSLFDTTPFTDTEGVYQTFENFGIQSFGFNVDGLYATSGGLDFSGLTIEYPDNASPGYGEWEVVSNTNQDGFGNFDRVVRDGGSSRKDPLMFWISGVDGDTIDTYSTASQGSGNNAADYWFAAHVTDYNTGEYGYRDDNEGNVCDPYTTGCTYQLLTSAYFTGGDGAGGGPPAGVIPVPAAVWLFASGLLGLVGVARRRKSS